MKKSPIFFAIGCSFTCFDTAATTRLLCWALWALALSRLVLIGKDWVGGGTFTLTSHGTALDSLPSHGSSCLLFALIVNNLINSNSCFIHSLLSAYANWTLKSTKHAAPFAPSPLQRLHHYYEAVCHCRGHRYFLPPRVSVWYYPLVFHACFSRSSEEPETSSCHLYAAHPADSNTSFFCYYPRIRKEPCFWCDLQTLLMTPHRMVCFRSPPCLIPCQSQTKGFQSSLTTHQLPSEQHEVVCNQCLFTECGGPATTSSEVTNYSPTNGRFVLVTHLSATKITIVTDKLCPM